MSDFSKQLEKKIKGKLSSIESGETDAKGSGVNDLIKKLKTMDEAAAETLQNRYIEAVKKANKK
mgnify:CR=1 FL=1